MKPASIVFRQGRPQDAQAAAALEAICFPPNEACTPERMVQRIEKAGECFLAAERDGVLIGFINGIATEETHLRDEFFTDITLHDSRGSYVMILGVAVHPDFRRQGLACAMMAEFSRMQEGKTLVLTCLEDKVTMYQKMGFRDLGWSASAWGAERWHEMIRSPQWEQFDLVDEQGNPTGQVAERKTAHALGLRHRTAHIWVVRRGEYGMQVLLQKRSAQKESFPGRYDTSAAGHIHAGDMPLMSAQRELEEELGICARQEELTFVDTFRVRYEKEFHGSLFKDNEVAFVYVYDRPVELEDLQLQAEELDGAAWFDLQEVLDSAAVHDPRFCVPTPGIRLVAEYLKLHN